MKLKYLFSKIMTPLLLVFSLGPQAWAQVTGDIQDGVNSQLDAASINDLLVWAHNSQAKLEKGLAEVNQLPQQEKRKALRNLVDSVIEKSADAREELLMRSVLRRARNFDSIIGPALPTDASGEVLAVAILTEGVLWATELYPKEKAYLTSLDDYYRNKTPVPKSLEFAALGLKSTRNLLNVLYLSPAVEISLALLKETLGLLYNDINRDLVARRQMAPALASILEEAIEIGIIDAKGVSVPTEAWLEILKGYSVAQKLNLERDMKAFLDKLLGQSSESESAKHLEKVNREQSARRISRSTGVPYGQRDVINSGSVGLTSGVQNSGVGSEPITAGNLRYSFIFENHPDGGLGVSGRSSVDGNFLQVKSEVAIFPFVASGNVGASSNKVDGVRYNMTWIGTGLSMQLRSDSKPQAYRAILSAGEHRLTQNQSGDTNAAVNTKKYGSLSILTTIDTDRAAFSAECRGGQAQKELQFVLCSVDFERELIDNVNLQLSGQKLVFSNSSLFPYYMPAQAAAGLSIKQGLLKGIFDRIF